MGPPIAGISKISLSVYNYSWNYAVPADPNAKDTSWSFDQHIPPGNLGIVQVNDGFQGIVCADGTKHYYDLSNRGPINSLASFLIGYNPNVTFSYRSAPGAIYLDTDEYYYFPLPGTTLTANVSAGSGNISLPGASYAGFPTTGDGWVTGCQSGSVNLHIGPLAIGTPSAPVAGDDVCATYVSPTLFTTMTDGSGQVGYAWPAGTPVYYVARKDQYLGGIPAISAIYRWGNWFPAMGVAMGAPADARNQSWMSGAAVTGLPGGNCGSFICSPVWRRDFANGTVFVRPFDSNGNNRFNPAELDTYSVPFCLSGTYPACTGGPWYRLAADGTTGPAIQSIQLRAGESAILMNQPGLASPSVVYYGEPKGVGQYPGGTNIANSWTVTGPAPGNSAGIDQTQSNLTFYMVGMDPAGTGPLVIQGVFTPGATPRQNTTPQSGAGIPQIANAAPASATPYAVTWAASDPSPWSMTWTNLTPQSTLPESVVQQMAAFDPSFLPSYYNQASTGGWNCQSSGIMTTGVFFFPCYTGGADSPAWVFAFQPGDGNPAHAGLMGGPNIVGAINTFNTPNPAFFPGPIGAAQGAVYGRTLHTITEAGETGWVGIAANQYSTYTPLTKSNLGSIPATGPAKCNTYVSTLSSTADCIAVRMAANAGSYEPYLVGAPNPPFTGAPGELRTAQVGDTACVASSSSGCVYTGPGASELMTLLVKNYGGVNGQWLLERDTDGVEASVPSGPIYFWWQSYQSIEPYNATNASGSLRVWWNPLTGCAGAPDPHGNCLLQDTNLGYGQGEWRDGGEALGVNVPAWKVPGAAMSEIAWPSDYQTIVGSAPGIFSLPFANVTPYQTAGVNFVSQSPPFATAFGEPFQPDAGQHPNPAGALASPYEQLQAFDNIPLQGGAYDPTFTPVSGQLYLYQPGTVTDADDFVTSGSVAYINRKLMATGASCGSHPLIDVSGPGSSISTATGSSYTYCVARGSGECYSGSAPGNVYVNCPGVTSAYCNGAATPLGAGNDICVGNLAKAANGIAQFTLNHTDYADAYTRVLAAATSRLRMVTGLENSRLLPDNSWLLYPQEFLNYQRPSEIWMLQEPPYPAADSINRGTFVPVAVTLKPPAGIGANNAIVEFGYQEYGAPQLLNCTTRNDVCIATASSVTSGNQPFYFASENPAGMACAAGCTIAIPAISQRILYYRVEYRAANNTVLAAGPLTSVVVP